VTASLSTASTVAAKLRKAHITSSTLPPSLDRRALIRKLTAAFTNRCRYSRVIIASGTSSTALPRVSISEFERDLIRERTQAGLVAARARGRQGGRPRRLDEKKIKMLQALYADKNDSVEEILNTLGISKSTFYRHVEQKGGK
jgi:transcriptional regulator of acetoin/glycerol metabolism